MAAGKRGKADKQARITAAYRLFCLRTPYNGVVKELVRVFNVCDRTARLDIAAAAELLKQDFEPDRELARNAGLAARNQLLVRAIKDEDFKLALSILDSTAKLEGLFERDYRGAANMIEQDLGFVIIDPKADNLAFYERMYNEALEKRDHDSGGYTPKSAQEQEDDISESCGYRRSHGTKRRPDPELIHEVN